MSGIAWSDRVTDRAGNGIAQAKLTFEPLEGGAPVQVYGDRELTNPIAQPITTDGNGEAIAFVDVGELPIRVTASLDGWSDELVWEGTAAIPSSLPPNGPAGGVLSGSYPDPGFAADMATQAELEAGLAGKQDAATAATDAELAAGLAGKADSVHTHDDRYYTEAEVDGLIAGRASDAELDAEITARAAGDTGVGAPNTQTGNYTLVLADAGKSVEANHATNAITVTVPPNSSVAFPVGTIIEVARYGAGAAAIAAGAGVTIRSKGGLLGIGNQYGAVSLRKRATDEWVLVGDLV